MNTEKEKTSTYFSGNKFFIVDTFNDKMRDGIIIPLTNKIEELAKQKDATLDVYINSRGGDGHLCFHIVTLLEIAKARGIKVRTIISQIAYSSGSIVAVAASEGERYISRRGEHCVHYGTQYGWSETTPLQIERNTDHKKRWFKQILDHYKHYAKVPDLKELLKDDSLFIPAAQCIEWGLADKYTDELK